MIRKFIAGLLMLSLLAASAAALANVKFTGSCFVYGKPGSGMTHTVVHKGSVLKDIDRYGKYWVKVELSDGSTGWVRAKYVADTSLDVEDKPSIYGSGGQNKSTEGDWVTAHGTKVTATGRVNVRDAACLSSRVLTTMHKGDVAKYLGKAREDSRGVVFYRIRFGDVTGWVSSGYSVLK